MKTYLVDTTLRDGEQAPGVIFKHCQKMEIAKMLDRIGIEEVEVGTPAMGEHEQRIIRDIAEAGFSFTSIGWCRALEKDIKLAVECKTDAVSISFPVSDVQLKAIGKSKEWVEQEIPRLVAYARQFFKRVYVGMQDATRCERESLISFVEIAVNAKADRIRIADTVGILNPVSVMELFTDLNIVFPYADFEFHPHNDIGMATANAFLALKHGASGISGTINGLGERAGNAALEELILANFLNEKKYSKYNTRLITEVCSYVADASRIPLSASKPISGANAFAHETGVHVRSVLKNKLSYQPFDEKHIGLKSNKIVIGKHSGKSALANFYNEQGANPSVEQLEQLHSKIQESIALRGKAPNAQFLMNLYSSLQFASPNYKA